MYEIEKNIIEYETTLRLFFFFGIFLLMATLEYLIPKRAIPISKSKRWLNNISLVFINSLILRLIFPTAAVGVSLYVNNNHIGLFNLFELDILFSTLFSIILLDLIIYWQHRFFHQFDFFWKFHKVHHSDMAYDVTTGFRFHPIEIIISMLIKFSFILLLGVPVISVVLFEIILSSLAIFNHSNINLPNKMDKIIRYFIVTPDMHRIHHSIYNDELNSNYGFNISVWDRIFKSYVDKPKEPYDKMVIGLKNLQDEDKTVSLINILKLPFIK